MLAAEHYQEVIEINIYNYYNQHLFIPEKYYTFKLD